MSKQSEKKHISQPHKVSLYLKSKPNSRIFVAGTFNDWDAESLPLIGENNNGNYHIALTLRPGKYEYKFIIDGVWCIDENNPDFIINDFGTLNSILKVQ